MGGRSKKRKGEKEKRRKMGGVEGASTAITVDAPTIYNAAGILSALRPTRHVALFSIDI